MGEGEWICPPQLNAAGFTQGSVHTKLSGPPGSEVKKWYKVTHAFNVANPSGSAADQKPEQGHYGIRLQYCGGDGTGGPYDETTCNTAGVDFYEGGCATYGMYGPEPTDGECPMIYSLATAQAKEEAANTHVGGDSGGYNGGGCDESTCSMSMTYDTCDGDCEWTDSGCGCPSGNSGGSCDESTCSMSMNPETCHSQSCLWTGSSCTCPGSHSDGSGGGTSPRCSAVDPSACGPDCYSYNSFCIPNAYYNNACWGPLNEYYCNGGGCVWDAWYGVCVLDSIQDDYL